MVAIVFYDAMEAQETLPLTYKVAIEVKEAHQDGITDTHFLMKNF